MTAQQRGTPNLLDHVERRGALRGAPLWAKLLMAVFAIGAIGGIAFTVRVTLSLSKAFSASANGKLPLLTQIQQLIAPPEKSLRGEERDRMNILLLGMGGEGHDGALLTDTIIVASLKPSTGQVGLFSLPRDLIVRIPGHEYRKVNYANAYGEQKGKPGSGAAFASHVVAEVLGAPVDYFVRVDFNGFARVIDDLGGIDVTVDVPFTDHSYPTENYGYQTVSFGSGLQHFEGETALKFVRSRHGNNGEGSDFARSRRQQKVLVALKEKVFSIDTLLNPSAVARVLTALGNHVQTDLQPWELVKLARLGQHVDPTHIASRGLDTTPDGLLKVDTGLDGAYILVPRLGLGKYDDIQRAFAQMFDAGNALSNVRARIVIENGTTVTGLAAQTAERLRSLPVTVVQTRNAQDRATPSTVLYDLSDGTKTAALTQLRDLLDAEVVSSLPSLLQRTSNSNGQQNDLGSAFTHADVLRTLQQDSSLVDIDFVIIVGTDQTLPTPQLNHRQGPVA